MLINYRGNLHHLKTQKLTASSAISAKLKKQKSANLLGVVMKSSPSFTLVSLPHVPAVPPTYAKLMLGL